MIVSCLPYCVSLANSKIMMSKQLEFVDHIYIVLYKLMGIHNAHVRKFGLNHIGQPGIGSQYLLNILLV